MKTKQPDSGKQSISSSIMDTTNSVTCEADSPQAIHRAIVCAVHETSSSPKKLYAILAPKQALRAVCEKWAVTSNDIRKFSKCLCDEDPVYICVPSSDNDDDHLPLEDFTIWYMESCNIACTFEIQLA